MEKINGSIDHKQQPQPQPQPPSSSSSFSWLLDNNNSRPSKSLWLQNTLSEVDGKIKKILEVVEDNGDTFAQRAEMYYQKRPQLIKMVEDLHKSYRALADKYDLIMLRSESSLRASNCCFSTSNSFRQEEVLLLQHNNDYNNNIINDHQPSSPPPPPPQYDDELTKLQKPADIVKVISCVNKSEEEEEEEKDVNGAVEKCHGWDELLIEVSKLIEENISKQGELIRRYNMKIEDMKQLVKENRRLRDLLAQSKFDINKNQSPSQTNGNSKWKPRSLFGKLLR